MAQAEIGLIGLGVMGANLALNIAEKGPALPYSTARPKRTDVHRHRPGSRRPTSFLRRPWKVRCHHPAAALGHHHGEGRRARRRADRSSAELLAKDDIIIDAGNANFRDTMRRFDELEGIGLTFIGMGVSGGEEGARHGPSIMVGGTPASMRGGKSADRHLCQVQGRSLLRLARRMAPAISSRPSTTASSMPTCR